MPSAVERVPQHLRQFVVQQDYAAYDEVDQAVWRFVLLQTHARLRRTAHPAYANGLAATGISVERIPRIADMDECLARFGWGAVCVDGFIPPRAFQEFQAAGLLPIAADIRQRRHLVYTPAPDIIHEAAGHAPILPDPEYAAYLRRIGSVGAKAFSSAEDDRVYRAVFTLSELKENPSATRELVAAAEKDLADALAGVTYCTEAGRLSRLYWWTAEYGLVGTPTDYTLYGAGLLSSLLESHSCHDASVKKIPLSSACVEVDYDITLPQPQLFVTGDFSQLRGVLDEVEKTLSSSIGGRTALEAAQRSGEVATLILDGGWSVLGKVSRVDLDGGEPVFFELSGPSAIAFSGKILEGQGRAAHPQGFAVPLGRLESGALLADTAVEDLPRAASMGTIRLVWRSGFSAEGRLAGVVPRPDDPSRVGLVLLEHAQVGCRGELVGASPRALSLVAASALRTAHAGAADPAYWPPTRFPSTSVPKLRALSPEDAELLQLYERAIEVWRESRGPAVVPVFELVHEELERRFPDEWLLRWNLLESLVKIGETGAFASRLRHELEALEDHHLGKEPILTGLRFLETVAESAG